jgi:co-chaperonin GroES (HSP10)
MKLQPVGRSLLVQVRASEKKSVLLLTRQHDEPMQVDVIGVGEKVEAPIKEGDVLLLFPYAGTKITGGTDDMPYLIIGEKDVLGVLKDAV